VRPSRSRALGAISAVAALAASSLLVAPAATAAEPTVPFISEIHYDNASTDVGEFVEVQVPEAASVTGWTVVLYNGSDGAVYDTDALPPAAGGVSVVNYVAPSALQNGSPDGLALVDAGGGVVEFLSYEGVFQAVGGPANGQTSIDIGQSEAGGTLAGQSLSKALETASGNYVWQPEHSATPGQLNPVVEPPPVQTCDEPVTNEIGNVQGSGASSPLAGSQVRVEGVVVGDLPELGGFYLQDADGDGDGSTSDGVFVASPVAVGLGDTVAVTGGVVENFGQTQITSQVDTVVCAPGSAADLPPATALDLPADNAAREPVEGMLVAPVDSLTVSEVFALTRFGELTLSEGGLLVQPTELARPGTPAALDIAEDNELRRILLDDGSNASRSATNRPYLSATTPVRAGDELTFTSPLVLGFGFGSWRLQPADGTPDGTFAPQNTRPAAPDAVGGDVKVGAFNVLNYFLTLSGPDARGATSAAQLEKQAAKIVTAIEALDADVTTLMEIEDTNSTAFGDGTPDQAVANLVSRLNAAAGFDKWGYSPLPDELLAVDRDVIRNAIIYQKGVVQPVGEPVGLVDESVWFNAREPIAQTFVKDGDRFTVVANHFKSKSPGAPTGDNVDSGDGQGQWNGDRMRQAASLAGFTDQLRQDTADEDVLVLGDLNSYTQEDPMEVLRRAGFADLGSQFDPDRYSYVFDELSGSLDHAMATAALTAKVTDVAHWNINAVESFAYQYTGDPVLYAANQFRSSDHDPLVVGIDLQERCMGLLPTIRGTDGNNVISGTTKRDVIMGLGGNDVIRGGNAEDVICGGAGNDTVNGEVGDDVLLGGFGDDAVSGGNGNDILIGGPGADALTGGGGQNQLTQEGAES
jgi:predicted extracellular nuclease